jgi:hypothetical protein
MSGYHWLNGIETSEVGYFSPNELPPHSKGRVLSKDIVAAFEFRGDPQRLALFD